MAHKSIQEVINECCREILPSEIPHGILYNRREKVFKGLTIEEFDKMLRPYGLKCTFTDKQIPFSHNWLVTRIENDDIY